ncbi:MAG TPA: GNAT family N-acetyltransferase [Vicinamibacterales bacterium]|nr:GNAT family N-acetyltransferase [Vicinamibacterales bacterium]
MEKMPKPPELEEADAPAPAEVDDWRQALPLLTGRLVSLREVRPTDAPHLVTLLTAPEVSRFLSTPPTTIAEFQRFVDWAIKEREAGAYACYVVVPHEAQHPVGLLHLRQLEPRFATAEWGFALGSDYWGSGFFMDSARLMIDFAFGIAGTHRLEARAALQNGRCNNALQKIGAIKEAVLRRAFFRAGEYLDQALWTIVEDDWFRAKTAWSIRVH